jgi:hypothetical protein
LFIVIGIAVVDIVCLNHTEMQGRGQDKRSISADFGFGRENRLKTETPELAKER